jgi:D-alanyl-D-alanine carboxypeptidase
MTRTFVFLLSILLVIQGAVRAEPLSAASAASGAGVEAGFQAPSTPIWPAVQDLVAALGSEDKAAIRDLIDRRFSARAFRFFLPKEQIAEQLETVRAQTGGVRIVEVRPQAQGEPLTVVAQPHRGPYRILLRVGADRDDPERLSGFGLTKLETLPAAELASRAPARSLDDMVQAIAETFDRQARDFGFTGALVLARHGKVLLARTYGHADAERKIPIEADTPFHIGSVGKMLTAVLVAKLVDEGRLSFSTKVGDVLADYPDKEVASKVTVQQLLTHTAGLGTFFESPGYVPARTYETATEELAVYRGERLHFEPGSSYRYSNAGYSLLAAMLEKITDRRYQDLVRERVLIPLGMSKTYLPANADAMRRSAVMYAPSTSDPLGLSDFVPLKPDDKAVARATPQGFGGGYSTVGDMLKFITALVQNQLLPPALTHELIAPKVKQDAAGTRFYGLGVMRSQIGSETLLGHAGGSRFDARVLEPSGFALVVASNRVPPSITASSLPVMDFIARSAEKL